MFTYTKSLIRGPVSPALTPNCRHIIGCLQLNTLFLGYMGSHKTESLRDEPAISDSILRQAALTTTRGSFPYTKLQINDSLMETRGLTSNYSIPIHHKLGFEFFRPQKIWSWKITYTFPYRGICESKIWMISDFWLFLRFCAHTKLWIRSLATIFNLVACLRAHLHIHALLGGWFFKNKNVDN